MGEAPRWLVHTCPAHTEVAFFPLLPVSCLPRAASVASHSAGDRSALRQNRQTAASQTGHPPGTDETTLGGRRDETTTTTPAPDERGDTCIDVHHHSRAPLSPLVVAASPSPSAREVSESSARGPAEEALRGLLQLLAWGTGQQQLASA